MERSLNVPARVIEISEPQLLELVRELLQKEIAKLRPLLREELLKSCELVDEEGGIAMLPMGGKDPKRTFRRLVNKHKIEYVVIDSYKWWKRASIQALIDARTLNKKKMPNVELKAVA